MRPWYIGESRAQNLLRYAQGVLAQYAYQLPYQGYLEVWNVLQSTIPLWVEERRGPRNPQTGQPLSLESDFKKYIDWWVYQLVAVRTGKESKVKASFVNKVFSKDPAGAVFGTRVAASRLQAGVEDDMAGQLDSMFQGIMDNATQFSSTDMTNLLIFGMNALNTLTGYYGADAARLSPIKTVLYTWMEKLFTSWLTASTSGRAGGLPGELGADPNWMNQWRYPAATQGGTGTPMFAVEGAGKMDAVKAKLEEILNFAVKSFASGNSPTQEALSAFQGQNIAFPTAQALQGLGLNAPSQMSLPVPAAYPTPGLGIDRRYEPGPDMPRTAADLLGMYQLQTKAKLALIVAGKSMDEATEGAKLFADAFVTSGGRFLTTTGGAFAAGQEALFVAAVKQIFQSVTGTAWGNLPSVI